MPKTPMPMPAKLEIAFGQVRTLAAAGAGFLGATGLANGSHIEAIVTAVLYAAAAVWSAWAKIKSAT